MKKRRRLTAFFCRFFFETEILRAKLEGNVQWLLSAGNKYCKGGIKLGGIRRVRGGKKRRKRRRQREYKEQNNALCKHYNLFWLLFVRLVIIETLGGCLTE